MSLMTIAKIRKVYNKTDAKSIAKQLGMSAHENATPIRILHNSCGHLSGPARSFGSILMGYLGKFLLRKPKKTTSLKRYKNKNSHVIPSYAFLLRLQAFERFALDP